MVQGDTCKTTVHCGLTDVRGSGRCVGDCALCSACVRRLPVTLMAQSRDAVPTVFATAVTCSRRWLRAHPLVVSAAGGGDAR